MRTNSVARELPTWFQDTDAGKQMIARDWEQSQAARRAALDRIEQIDREREQTLPGLNAAVAEAETRVAGARKMLEHAEGRRMAAVSERTSKSLELDLRQERQKRFLRQTADPAFDAFITELLLEDARTRNSLQTWKEETGFIVEGRLEKVECQNVEAVQRRVTAIKAAIAKAEQLKLALCDDVPGTLQQFREDLPEL